MSDSADVIVVGLGAAGSATLYQLARAGIRAIGIDRWQPPHAMGSSHGETRITRQAIGEGDAYVPLALRSHEIWRELEHDTGQSLLNACGVLIIGSGGGSALMHGRPGFVRCTAQTAAAHGIKHELLSPDEAQRRYPHFRLTGDELVYFEPGGGFVYPERCIAAQLSMAERLGATICTGEQVLDVQSTADGASVRTATCTLHAGHVILSAGAWNPRLAGGALDRLALRRQVLHWFAPERPQDFAVGAFPAFIWVHGNHAEDSFYGFPIPPDIGHALVKLADENQTCDLADPDQLDRTIDPDEVIALHRDHLTGRLNGLLPRPVRSAACVYTCSPDADFLVGPLPGRPHVTVLSACSGHGFKHSAALGEHAVTLVQQGPSAAIAAFAPDRKTTA